MPVKDRTLEGVRDQAALQSHFVVNLRTREFHVNPLGRATALAQHARADCHTGEIQDRKFADDFAALVVEGFFPCAHCVARLAALRH